jgi:Aspartyl protease/PDZ domain
MFFRSLLAPALVVLFAASSVSAQLGGAAPPNPRAILQLAKDASGGSAWDALRSQHSTVTVQAAGLAGTAERWSDTTSGKSRLDFSIGPLQGAAGFDGKVAWTQDDAGIARDETDDTARELAVNAAFRDRLAFWYPERGAAVVSYKERASADGADFDVIRITPEGGRAFELWINVETRLIERLVEREARAVRTEIYMDLRDLQGVKIPYRVRATREDPRQDEVFVVEKMEFNRPLTGVAFARPAPPRPDFAFPRGRAEVVVPLDHQDGHLFVRVRIDGKGPFRMLLDSGSINALLPEVARTLKLKPGSTAPGSTAGTPGDGAIVRAQRLDIGGVVISRPAFATIDLKAFLQRVEGVDDVAGILGYELFKRMPVTIDYDRARLVLHDPASFKYAGKGALVPLAFRGTMPTVRGRLDGIDGVFDVGTGARPSLTLTSSFAASNDLAAKYGASKSVIAGAGPGGHVRGTLARAGELDLGEVVVTGPVVVLATPDAGAAAGVAGDAAGSIGYGVLRRLSPTFDYARKAAYFDRGAKLAETDSFERAGLWLERGPTGFVVVDVVVDGPAAAAGVKAGDVVTAVNGKAAGTLSLAAARASLRAPAGSRLLLQLGDAGERTVILRDLI